MLISLEEPFKSLWKKGYLQVHPNNRKYVCLYNSQEDRTIVSYARYLMSVYLGKVVPDEFEVDHIIDDPTDDRIDNLQLLSQEENLIKQHYKYIMESQNRYGFHCAWCSTPFILTERELKMRLAQGVEMAFCSRSCGTNFHFANNPNMRKNNLTDEQISEIKKLRLEGLSGYKISEQLNIGRNTVMKYW